MGPAQALESCFRKYVTFSGRAQRSEFWWFWLSMSSLGLVLSLAGLQTVRSLLTLATLLPMLAVTWRRMHDANSSGAIGLLPMAMCIVAIYIQLFAMLGSLQDRMAGLKITPDTTLREMQQQLETVNTDGGLDEKPNVSAFAILVSCAGGLWLVYLLARPSSPGTNSYGPNPLEVPK